MRSPFELDSLIDWLEKQPTEREYCYTENGRCLLVQYFTAVGFRDVCLGSTVMRSGLTIFALSPGFNAIALLGDRNFGAAFERAKALRSGKLYIPPNVD